jgi:predicted kinase
VLALYQAHRALVRAKVAALSCAAAAPQTNPGGWREEQRRLIECARRALLPRTPVLLLMCGLSGSGKTWLAEQLAPRLQLVHLRSDVERKRSLDLGALAHSGSGLQQGLYSEAATREVYARLETCAQDILAGGYGALVDATFARRADRARFRALAARLGVSLQLIHCHAAPAILRARIAERRRAAADASEADESVLSWQTGHFEAVGVEEALPLIDADTSDPQTPQRVLAALAAAGVIDS